MESAKMDLSRRGFIRKSATATAFFGTPVLRSWGAGKHHSTHDRGPAHLAVSLNEGWLFGGKLQDGMLQPGFNDTAFSSVTLPHTVTSLSWQNWDPATWEDVWAYRHHFALPPEFRRLRVFLHFDKVMATAKPVLNGHSLPQHAGGFLPFEYEITDLIKENGNLLAVTVDSRWQATPPAGSPKGPQAVDYMLPGGICGGVQLRAVPKVFIRDVFAKAVDVLNKNRRLDLICTLDAKGALPASMALRVSLKEKDRIIATTTKSIKVEKPDQEFRLTLNDLENIVLWDVETPKLYHVLVTLLLDGVPLHDCQSRIGFRDARFELDGFFLNGKRLRLFGLNRHELYPYLGFATPERLLRRDAQTLRQTLNCNIVRCSHYPESTAFLDACDELGLLVWEETPGWQYIGDQSWQDIAVQNVHDMVLRDRNHPSIVIWGVRINESANNEPFYSRTRAAAKALDDSRPTSGSMTSSSKKTWHESWHEDVFAYDDYHSAPDGSVGIFEPVPGVPYMLAETVGQYSYEVRKGFDAKYRRTVDPDKQMRQALRHAQAHSRAANFDRCAGVIAWCAFDYASLRSSYDGVKYPGIADVFRTPKLGASFYFAQVDPRVRVVMEPNFYWDFGSRSPSGPGLQAAIFSNCERIDLTIDGKPHAVLHPDAEQFPHIKYPPFFVDLDLDGASNPELRMDGYIGGKLVLSRSFSADNSTDKLRLNVDDAELQADGADMTRLEFAIVDKFGALRPFGTGKVSLSIDGPGLIVGDNPFVLDENGGSGAVWIKTMPGRAGRIQIQASHPSLGHSSAEITVHKPDARTR
jgi:beta-galactosidase